MLEISKSLLDEIEAGGTVVAPSRQRATAMRLAYASAKLAARSSPWRTPDALSFGAWLERESSRRSDPSDLRTLSSAEEWLLWRRAVSEAMRDAEMPPTDSLVESLQRSARLMFDWRIPVGVLSREEDAESALLARALEVLEERCREMDAVAAHRLIEKLQTAPGRTSVTFAGFTERAASRAALCERWSEQGASIREYRSEHEPGAAFIAAPQDATEEIIAAAAWCRAQLQENPNRRLLVVVPDLSQRRYAVAQAFEQALAPRALMGLDGEAATAHCAVEGGQALASYALVRHALTSLHFLCGKLDFTRWSAWLRSAFWAASTATARAKLENSLRRGLDIELGLAELLSILQSAPGDLAAAAQAIREPLMRAAHELEPTPGPVNALQWSRRFRAALHALGWPGGRPLSSAEQQTMARFQEVLADFATLTLSLGSMRTSEAVRVLADLVGRTTFEPATGDPAVTLTSALTDPIVRYDGIWVAGLHADAWPQSVAIDPFIPLAAQRQSGMPWVHPGRLLEQARAMLQSWQRSAGQLVLSWPRHDGDREYLPSPLLDELPGVRPWDVHAARPSPDQLLLLAEPTTHASPTLAHVVRQARRVEIYEDAAGEPWPALMPVPAGTRTIEYQNSCPVRAYAELRLACTQMETPRPGVDVRERGTLLHRALELLWTRLGGWQELTESFGERLNALIDESISRAMADAFGAGGVYQQQRSLLREHRRTARLIRELCEVERQRPPFRVRWLETRRSWSSSSGCSLDLRIDRIDELEDGAYAIFDYKTGAPQSQDWTGERVTHPQLLVYMLAAGVDVAAMATIQLAPARVSFRGIADRKGRLPRVTGLTGEESATGAERWLEQQDRWRASIEQLATDFLAGKAALDPMANACLRCHLHTFCRIADVSTDEISDDE